MDFHSYFSDDSAQIFIFLCEINSYKLQSSYKMGRDVIKVGELVLDSLYLIPFPDINQWYTSNEK